MHIEGSMLAPGSVAQRARRHHTPSHNVVEVRASYTLEWKLPCGYSLLRVHRVLYEALLIDSVC